MYRLPTIWLLLTLVVLLGGAAMPGQQPALRRPPASAADLAIVPHSVGPTDLAPSPERDDAACSELAARVRRRLRAGHGDLPAVVSVGATLPCAATPTEGATHRLARLDPATPGRDLFVTRDVQQVWRREWARAAELLLSRPAYGDVHQPPLCVMTFCIDGPRQVPLMLFD
ncbi:MAG: hypothetical protein R3F29_00725 [Planctomycetota bacterium]